MIPGLAQLGPRRRSSRQQQQQQQELERQINAEEHRSRNHHHYHHHYHHHHHHHSRPRAANRYQHSVVDPPSQGSSSSNTGSDAASSSRTIDSPSSSSPSPYPNPDHDRLFHTRLPSLMQRRSQTEAHRAALEARGRLDERLRREATFLGRRNPDASLPRLAQYYFNALFPDEDDETLAWEDESELETSLTEWLAGRVSGAGFRESWQPDWMNELPPSPIRGLSKAAMNALPREVYAQKKRKPGDDQQQQVDCSVCLEQFVVGQSLVCLPCRHRFHPACLAPWLEHHEQCPYCRARVHSGGGGGGGGGGAAGSSASDDEEGDDLLAWLASFETGMSRMRFNSNGTNR